jgi:hypothetical protein
MNEIKIEATNIRFNFYYTVITPMVINITDAVAMGTRVTTVITMRLKLGIIQGINIFDVTEVDFG